MRRSEHRFTTAMSAGLAALTATMSAPLRAAAQESNDPPRHASAVEARASYDTSGLALLGGLGTQYGSAGFTAEYYLPIGPWPLHVAPFASLGRWVIAGTNGAFAPAGGVALAFGHRHRIYADVSFGPMRSQTLQLHGTVVDARLLYGLETGIGWEYMAASGFTLRILPLGLAVGLDPRLPAGGHTAYYAPAAAIGWKLW